MRKDVDMTVPKPAWEEAQQRYMDSVKHALDAMGANYEEYVSPEQQKLNDAMERGDYLRDRAKDERAERKS